MSLTLYSIPMEKDALEELIEEGTRRNPEFPTLLDEYGRRRDVVSDLQAERKAQGQSQTLVAAKMGTSASVLSKLEWGGDVKLSTLQRYAAAVGKVLVLSLEDAPKRAPVKKPATKPAKKKGPRRR
jgi:ribosome-binding protein aMBF1 (putative translation factor)